jgi:hypothetical protein
MLWVSDFTFAKTIFHKILSQGAFFVNICFISAPTAQITFRVCLPRA